MRGERGQYNVQFIKKENLTFDAEGAQLRRRKRRAPRPEIRTLNNGRRKSESKFFVKDHTYIIFYCICNSVFVVRLFMVFASTNS
jgi:hypothetical protein